MPPSYPFVRAVLSFVALAISLSACGAKVEQKAPPLNPQARESYRLEVWAEDPPRPMQVESMQAVYQVKFVNCLPARAISGAPALDAEFLVPLRVEATEGGRFASTVYADRLVSTDLYGRGECRWLLASVRTIWSDGATRYRQTVAILPINGETLPVLGYAIFASDSREIASSSSGQTAALPITAGKGHGAWPSGEFEDINRRPTSVDGATSLGPYRALSPQSDFRVRSRSDRADNS